MQCRKVKELLSTDYIDNQLSEHMRQQIDQHIKECVGCRTFKQDVLQAMHPFQEIQEITPPECVWHNIQDALFKQRQERVGVLEYIKDVYFLPFRIPRPALVFATALLVVFIAIGSLRGVSNRQMLVSNYLDEQIEFVAYLDNGTIDTRNEESMDMGTAIEEYLL